LLTPVIMQKDFWVTQNLRFYKVAELPLAPDGGRCYMGRVLLFPFSDRTSF